MKGWLGSASFLLGVLMDFLFNGVLKIIWIVIYGPAYLVLVIAFSAWLGRSRFAPHSRPAVGALLAGALAAHLLLTGYTAHVEYSMVLASSDPITLSSEDWPQRLIVASDRLSKQLAQTSAPKRLPVVLARVTDYGCTRTSEVESVAGVDVRSDPDSRWTWKTDSRAQAVPFGPGYEDQVFPWCRFKFYRGKT